MIVEIGAGLASLKTALEVAKTLQAGATAVAVDTARAEMLQALIGAQQALLTAGQEHMALQQRITDLEAQIAKADDWKQESARYEARRYRLGVICYELKPAHQGQEPPHRLCAHCYQRGQKSLLQTMPELERGLRVWSCGTCKARLAMGEPMSDDEEVG